MCAEICIVKGNATRGHRTRRWKVQRADIICGAGVDGVSYGAWHHCKLTAPEVCHGRWPEWTAAGLNGNHSLTVPLAASMARRDGYVPVVQESW